MNETLARNIEALTTTGAIPPPVAPAPFQLIAFDSDGDPQLRTPDGRTIRLGSARNPLAEAEALVRAALESAPPSPAVAVIGAGTGAILEVLATTPVQHILVFEPDAELALAWLSRRSWVEMILANRLRLLVGPEYLGTANAARAVAGVERLPIVAHPVLTREYPDAMLAARSAVDRVVRDAAANANARERFEDLAFRNTLTNLPSLLGEADAGSLAGAFEGRPAIVVGAGPSLDVNVEALRPFQSSCLIVAADTAVVPCVKGGLTPHLAVALDPSLDNARHLTRMAVPESVHLVCEASVDASVPRAFGGRTFFFRVGRHAPWPWLEAAGVRLATLDAWGSVVTSALDLAVRAGCSPIIFAGLDLAFTRGQNYCRHTPLDDLWTWRVAAGDRLDDLWAAHRNARPIVMERAIEGGETPTAAHLVAFRDWIRDYAAARPHIRFVNGTGAGILRGTGIEIAALGDLATSIPTTKTPDITQTVSRIRAAARPPAQEANVLARVAAVSPLELLEGHSAPEAAAERMDVAEVQRIAILRTPPAAMTAHRGLAQTFEDGLAGAPLFLPDAARALRAIDPGQADAFVEMSERNPTRARECLDQALEAIRNVLLRELNATQGGTYHDARANVWNHVPAVVQVEWPPDVRPLVETATKAIHDAIRSSDCPLRLNDRPSAYFMAPSDPRVEVTPTGPSVGDAPVAPAQVGVGALVWQWAHVAATVLGADATRRPCHRLPASIRPTAAPVVTGPHRLESVARLRRRARSDSRRARRAVPPWPGRDARVERLAHPRPGIASRFECRAVDGAPFSSVRASLSLDARRRFFSHAARALVGHRGAGRPHRSRSRRVSPGHAPERDPRPPDPFRPVGQLCRRRARSRGSQRGVAATDRWRNRMRCERPVGVELGGRAIRAVPSGSGSVGSRVGPFRGADARPGRRRGVRVSRHDGRAVALARRGRSTARRVRSTPRGSPSTRDGRERLSSADRACRWESTSDRSRF